MSNSNTIRAIVQDIIQDLNQGIIVQYTASIPVESNVTHSAGVDNVIHSGDNVVHTD